MLLGRYRVCHSFRPGMHNIWPAGKMWPAEAFDLALKTPFFVYLSCFFDKTPFECVKTYKLWPMDMSKKFLGPPKRFELCTPDLD